MSSLNAESIRSLAQTAVALADLLERMEQSPSAIDADQYRIVVSRLRTALSQPLPAVVLDAVLSGHPAAQTLYENMHYSQSGLSRTPLDRSIASEQLATQLLARLARESKSRSRG
jgi:hypothetical protein